MQKVKSGVFIGIDPSLSATGIAAIRVRDTSVSLIAAGLVPTTPDQSTSDRLVAIRDNVRQFLSNLCVPIKDMEAVGIEDFSRGSKFRREEMGMALAAVTLGLPMALLPRIVMLTPRLVKRAACPEWYGFSLANWKAANKRGKFKMSMPDKRTMGSALFRNYAIVLHNEHEVDACAVAIAAMQSKGKP